METHYHVQNHVGDDVIFRIGCYTQTCSHIEHALWLYYFHVQPAHPNDNEKKKRVMDLRLNVRDLIGALKTHLKKAHPDDKALLESLITDVENGLDERNRIIHGALGFDPNSKGYFHFGHWRADKGKPHDYEKWDKPLPVSALDEILNVADDILIRARELHLKAIKRDKMVLRQYSP